MKKGRIFGGGFGALLAIAATIFFVGPPEPPKASAQVNSQCLNQSPGFTAGGNVFQRSAAQWNQYFASKVDAVNGVLCNPTIIGTPPFPAMPPHTVAGNPTDGVAPAISVPSNTGTIKIDDGSIDLNASCSDLLDDGTACTANTGTSAHTLGFLDGNKTDSGNNTYSGNNTHSGTDFFATVNGTTVPLAGTSLLLDATYCGKTVYAQNAATTTVTLFPSGLPAGKTCAIGVVQRGAGNVVFANGGGTSILNPIGCTRAFGQGAIASLYVAGDDPNVWFLGGSCLP